MNIFTVLKITTGLAAAKGDDWIRARHILSPTFSLSKMKMVRIFSHHYVQLLYLDKIVFYDIKVATWRCFDW